MAGRIRSADDELASQAAVLREEARRLLEDDGLLTLIKAVGPTTVIGSYTLDLMTWPDIDISLQLPHETDVATFFGLGQRVALGFQVAKMSYSNMFLRTDQAFGHGLYWGIRLIHGGGLWKIDLWAYGREAYKRHMAEFEQLRCRLANLNRAAILRIKSEVCLRPQYRADVTSMDVYEAVEQGMRSVAEFDRWLERRVASREGAPEPG